MRTCIKCGVEVEQAAARCPLCGAPFEEERAAEPSAEEKAPEPPVPEARLRRWLWEVISLLALTAAGIIFAIDLADGFRITWSLYPLSVVAFLWVSATSLVLLRGRPAALLAALAVGALGFLLVLSLITPGRPWFLGLALPLAVLAAAVTAATWAVVRKLRIPVLPAIGTGVLASGLAAVGTEYVLNRYLGLSKSVSWSLVAMACATSLFFALLLIHKRLAQRHADIRRFFHL